MISTVLCAVRFLKEALPVDQPVAEIISYIWSILYLVILISYLLNAAVFYFQQFLCKTIPIVTWIYTYFIILNICDYSHVSNVIFNFFCCFEFLFLCYLDRFIHLFIRPYFISIVLIYFSIATQLSSHGNGCLKLEYGLI